MRLPAGAGRSLALHRLPPGRHADLPLDLHRRAPRAPREFYVFNTGSNRAAVCTSGGLCHVWVSRLDEDTLLRTIAATQVGKLLLSGETLSLEGVTCYGCCRLLESRVRQVEGVKDAAVDIASLELVVTPAGGRIDLEKVLHAIREAGFEARKR